MALLTITLKGSPFERGLQQGEQLKDEIKLAKREVFYSQLFKEAKPSWAPVPLAVFGLSMIGKSKIKKACQVHVPRQHEKLLGIAKGSGISRRLAYGLNFLEQYTGDPKSSYKEPLVQDASPSPACTMVFALPPATADGSMIYGRNYDFPNIFQPYQMLRYEYPDDGYKNINLGQYPTAGTHVGMNEKGLVIAENYGRSWKTDPLDFRMDGVPNMMIIQEALENLSTTQEVIEYITKFPARTNGCHFGVVDESGDACVIETTTTRFSVRQMEDGILAHSNMYQTDELMDANVPDHVLWKYKGLEVPYTKSPKARYKRAKELLEKNKGNITFDTIKEILSDHQDGPSDFSVCCHGHTGSTLASIIVKPKEREFHVANNTPCETDYVKYRLE
ncbi:MAG: C45 family autoproteolytic acyltransferase/hydrolase [Promethearchaeota archaeon]